MKLQRLIISIIILVLSVTNVLAGEKKVIKGFSGGMMIHTGYQFGGDNPYSLNISSPTFGIGGCAKLHLTKHFRTGFVCSGLPIGCAPTSGCGRGIRFLVYPIIDIIIAVV